METISADAATLMRQSITTTATYLVGAEKEIDAVFGDGYAKRHPKMAIAFMTACLADFATAMSAAITQDSVDSLTSAIRDLADCLAGGTG